MNNLNRTTPKNTKQILTKEEIETIKARRKAQFKFNNNVDIRSICNHMDNGYDIVMSVNDGSCNVYCPICNDVWKPDLLEPTYVTDIINDLINDIKNIKWCADIDRGTMKELCGFKNLLEQYLEFREEIISGLSRNNNDHSLDNMHPSVYTPSKMQEFNYPSYEILGNIPNYLIGAMSDYMNHI